MPILVYIEGLRLILLYIMTGIFTGFVYLVTAFACAIMFGIPIAIVIRFVVAIVHIAFTIVKKNYIYYLSKTSTKKFIKYIKKHDKDIDWELICTKTRLTKGFLKTFAKKLTTKHWDLIWRYQKLTPSFVASFIDNISPFIFCNPTYSNLPSSIKLLLKQKFNQ
jgi:hypothetical protein